jgi:peptide/nickel transport system permease protein
MTAADVTLGGSAPATSRHRGALLYVAGRLGAGILVLFGAVTVSFLLVHATGNPATVLAGGSLPAAQVHALSVKLGYNRPLISQYGSYIVAVLHGDFGVSYRYQTPAINSVMTALPNTLALIGISLTAALLLSMAIAVSSVLSRKGWADRVWRPLVVVLQGIPDFWIALILVLVLAVHLHLLPSLGFAGPKTLIMPCVALTIPMLASFTRLLRANLLDFTNSDIAFALRARGLTRREIVLGHSFRNAMATFISFVALQAGWLIGGTVIVETIFAWPGIGTLLISAVLARDLTVIQAIVVVIAAAFILLNLLADLVVLWLDPRIGRATPGLSR